MHSNISNITVEGSLANNWINWCRLCAKDDEQRNINFLYQSHECFSNENKKVSVQEALEKYFGVQASLEDYLPKMLCTDCLSLVSSMIIFNERVRRVQLMFSHLAETHTFTNCLDFNSVRLKFEVTESERDQWFKKCLLNEIDKKCNEFYEINNEESKQSPKDDKFEVQIKEEENNEKILVMNYDKYIEKDSDSDLEKEEIDVAENGHDSFPEDEEDPFQRDEKAERVYSAEGVLDKTSQSLTDKSELPKEKSKIDRSKKKRKRKKLNQFIGKEVIKKKKSTIKDIKMETECNECGNAFSKYTLYREHMQKEHNHSRSDKHWPCPACDKVLLSLYNLERHVRIHVPLEVRQTIKCPECDNRYTSNAQLETHVRYKHKNEKPFICEECGLCLRTNSNLRQHMLTHTDIAPYECEVCKKKFKNKTRLKTHMDIHSPTKHVCNICGLQLNSRATLNRHFLVHSDDMQHKCDYCGKAFKRAKALKNHLLLHTGLKPYSCDFCDRTFANGSNCRSHMKKTHPEELAILEASGNKTHTKNIPKLETLKAVTKAADNLTPVVTKSSGCFAFGKKPKQLDTIDTIKQPPKSQHNFKINNPPQNSDENIAINSSPSTPLDLQYIPLVGNSTNSVFLSNGKTIGSELSSSALTTPTPIPNFDNIYQHLLKQNQTELQIKQTIAQISSPPIASSVSTPNHNQFYHDAMNDSVKPSSQTTDDLLHNPESQHSSMTSLTHNDHSNASSSINGTFYGSIKSTFPPANFM